jgi:hypothetical protein
MSAAVPATIVDAGNPDWDDIAGDHVLDPHCSRAFAAAHGGDGRAVLLSARGDGWSAVEVLVLHRLGDVHVAAVAPLYGGPWLQVDAEGDASAAAREARAVLDAGLRQSGVVSRVAVFSPWLPHAAAVGDASAASAGKPVCLARLTDPDSRWAALGSARRAEVRRAERDGEVRWEGFDVQRAERFASVYETAMERLDAPARWRLERDYFVRLAVEAGPWLHLSTAETSFGGAAALVLSNRLRGVYLYAARWGQAPGASSAALWRAQVELRRLGVEEMLLGGGVTNAPDDPLLRFKRAFADREVPIMLAAGAFDRRAHEVAAAAGQARPLPETALDL